MYEFRKAKMGALLAAPFSIDETRKRKERDRRRRVNVPIRREGNRKKSTQKRGENDSEREDVGTDIDVHRRDDGLFGAHVLGCSDQLAQLGLQHPLGKFHVHGFRDSEIDHLDGG